MAFQNGSHRRCFLMLRIEAVMIGRKKKNFPFSTPNKKQTKLDIFPLREVGAVLLLVEIFALVFMIFAGLAIDSSLMTTSKAQQRHTAEYIALESLHTYLTTTTNPSDPSQPATWSDKLDAAQVRAEKIAGINIFVSTPFEENPGQASDLGTNIASTNPTSSHPQVTGDNGRIIPGKWHFIEPQNLDCTVLPLVCPCVGGQWSGPCFQEALGQDLQDPTFVNAFSVELHLHTNSPIRTLFARVQGPETYTIASTATATFVPRHGIFLIALSRSAHRTTHLPYETLTGGSIANASESAFKLAQQPCPDPIPPSPNGCGPLNACHFEPGTSPTYNDSFYDTLWNKLPMQPTRPATEIPGDDPRRHYKDDYECFPVQYHEGLAPTSPLKTESYLVDTFSNYDPSLPAGPYDGPEPLNSMLDGVHYALSLFSDPTRGVPGDRIGAIGFDKAADIPERIFGLSQPGDADFTALIGTTDIAGQKPAGGTGLALRDVRYRDHVFLPRVEGGMNFPDALFAAQDMLLATPDAAAIENFVVMMSNGLTNCSKSRGCGSAEEDYQQSFDDSQDILIGTNNYADNYKKNNIRFHFILFGNEPLNNKSPGPGVDLPSVPPTAGLGPHTLLYSSSPDGCMKDDEARLKSNPFVQEDPSQDFNAMLLGQGLYFHPNNFYDSVKDTNGIWGPIRPCCTKNGACANVEPDLDSECDNVTKGALVKGTAFTDADGRLFCDSGGRNNRDQVHYYIDQIMKRNPYVLVE